MFCHFVGAVDILLSILASTLRFAVEHDRESSFGNEEEMDELRGAAKYELNPKAPAPAQILLNKAADHGPDD